MDKLKNDDNKVQERDPAVFCLWKRTANKTGKDYWITTINDKDYVLFANKDGHMFAHPSNRGSSKSFKV